MQLELSEIGSYLIEQSGKFMNDPDGNANRATGRGNSHEAFTRGGR